MWVRWVLSLGVGAILLVALIVFVDNNNSNSEANPSAAAVARANREDIIVVREDQAPHVAAVAAHADAARAITAAVRHEMDYLSNRGIIDGPVGHTSCRRIGGSAARPAFRCNSVANDVNYPFLGVVDVRARQVVYCKRDYPPVPSENIPISPRCQAG